MLYGIVLRNWFEQHYVGVGEWELHCDFAGSSKTFASCFATFPKIALTMQTLL